MAKELLINEFKVPTELLENELWSKFPLDFGKICSEFERQKSLVDVFLKLKKITSKLLFLAVLAGNFTAFEHLLSKKERKEADKTPKIILGLAIERDLIDVVEYLATRYDLTEDKWILGGEYNALQYAALYGNTGIVKLLMRNGFNPLNENKYGENAEFCARNGRFEGYHNNIDCVEFIKKHGFSYFLLFNINKLLLGDSKNSLFKDAVKYRDAIFSTLKAEYSTAKVAYLAAKSNSESSQETRVALANFKQIIHQLESLVSCNQEGYFANNLALVFHAEYHLFFTDKIFKKPSEVKELPQVVKDIQELIADGNRTICDTKMLADEKSFAGRGRDGNRTICDTKMLADEKSFAGRGSDGSSSSTSMSSDRSSQESQTSSGSNDSGPPLSEASLSSTTSSTYSQVYTVLESAPRKTRAQMKREVEQEILKDMRDPGDQKRLESAGFIKPDRGTIMQLLKSDIEDELQVRMESRNETPDDELSPETEDTVNTAEVFANNHNEPNRCITNRML